MSKSKPLIETEDSKIKSYIKIWNQRKLNSLRESKEMYQTSLVKVRTKAFDRHKRLKDEVWY